MGNRLAGPWARTSYTYGAGNELISSLRSDDEDDAISYEYDNNGNLVKKTETDGKGWTYGYDFENRLVKAVKRKGLETKTITFKYDPFGRRMEKKAEEAEDGKIETKTYTYVYDNEDIVLEYLTKTEDGETKTETTRYVQGPGIDEPLAIERKGEMYYYHADGLGSIVALTDVKQKVVESYSYDSFGEVKRKGDKVKNTYTFTGREWDKEVELYYYRARYYDAKVGRFISKDPIGFVGGDVNLYSYVGGNPVNYTDPWGLVTWPTNYPVVTSPYGPRGGGFHSGIDIRNPSGGTTYAADSGIVIKVWHDSRGGNQILILNDDGTVSGYAHTAPNVKEEQRVTEGQPIGYSDDSGSGAPHLHYTYRPCPTCPKIDPMDHLKDAKEPCK